MSDQNKKRTSSFRKIFPSFFGAHTNKSKAKKYLKSSGDEKNIIMSDATSEPRYDVFKDNLHHDPLRSHSDVSDRDSASYEHIHPYNFKVTDSVNGDPQHIYIHGHESECNVGSSSSTLVSATNAAGQQSRIVSETHNSEVLNGNNKLKDAPEVLSAYRDKSASDNSMQYNVLDSDQNIDELFDSDSTTKSFIVQNVTLAGIISDDSSNYEPNESYSIHCDHMTFCPKAYYHNLPNKLPVTQLDRSKNLKSNLHSPELCSVSAEIKSFNTQIMTSPKREAEVKVRKEMRARSLSIEQLVDKSKLPISNQINKVKIESKTTQLSDYHIDKPYTYTAPTAFKTTQKIPNMPELHKNMSPYAEVRKNIAKGETQQPRTNIAYPQNVQTRRTDDLIQNHHFTPADYSSEKITNNIVKSEVPKTHQVRRGNSSDLQKLRNRQNVEAFYWQQIKQIKFKQEQDFIKKAANDKVAGNASANFYTTTGDRSTLRNQAGAALSNDERSISLPRSNMINAERNRNGTEVAFLHNSPVSKLKKYDPYKTFIRGAQIRNTTGSMNMPKSYLENRNADIVYRHPEKLQKLRSISALDHVAKPLDHRIQGRSHSVQLVNSAKEKRINLASQRSSNANIMSPKDNSSQNNSIRSLTEDMYSNNSGVVLKSANTVKPNVVHGHLTQSQLSPSDFSVYGKIKYKQFLNSSMRKKLLCHQYNSAEGEATQIDLMHRAGELPPTPPKRTTSSSWNSAASTARNLLSRRVLAVAASPACDGDSGTKARAANIILQCRKEDDWESDRGGDGGVSDGEAASRAAVRMRPSRRDDPRRHTLGGGNSYGPLHHHHQAMSMGSMDGLESRAGAITRWIHDGAEYSSINREPPPITMQPSPRQPFPSGGYQPSNSSMMYDDDPGIMSEVETSSTGFRRGGKQRSSLPVVRTPSKTLERPLGLVFLQFRNETKRALLPNEVTSIDTVKALFVRSFNSLLSMEYLESPQVKVYIHDSSKDMFYELEDSRAHLRDIRDRSVIRLFELKDLGVGAFPGAVGGGYTGPGVLGGSFQGSAGGGGGSVSAAPVTNPGSGPPSWDQDQSYFSEPEIDSEYNHQHIHKSNKMNQKPPAYYMGTPRAPTTLPRTGAVMRAYSPGVTPVPADRVKSLPPPGAPPKPMRGGFGPPGPVRGGSERCYPFVPPSGPDQLYNMPLGTVGDGYMSSPERISRGTYEDPYYNQFTQGSRPAMTPVISEEANDGAMMEDQYGMYGVSMPPGRGIPRSPYDPRLSLPNEEVAQRMRVEHMERQLANLTAIVHKGFSHTSEGSVSTGYPQRHPSVQDQPELYRQGRNPKLGLGSHQKSVSFEKSVSFSDDPPDMNSPKQHSPQLAADPKPTKPAIKSSTLPRMSSQDRDRLKPAPPPKPVGLAAQAAPMGGTTLAGRLLPTHIAQPFISDLRNIYNKCRDIRSELNHMKRVTKIQADSMKDLVTDTMEKLHDWADTTLLKENNLMKADDISMRSLKEEMDYRFDMAEMEEDLFHLEEKVEKLRGKAAIKDIKVDMDDVEDIALVLSKSSNTVGKWKERAEDMAKDAKHRIGFTVKKIEDTEKLVEQMPERIEDALRRCKKLTGTLVTLKRLACVQEQRLPNSADEALSPQLAALAAASQSEEMALVKEIHAHAYEIREAHARAAHARDVHAHVYEQGHIRGHAHANEGRSHGHDMHDGHAHSHDHNGHGHGVHGHEDLSSSGSSRMNAPPDHKVVGPGVGRDGVDAVQGAEVRRAENALDALLDELQTFARPPDACDPSPPPRASLQAKPPVPERHPDLLALAGRRAPPPPPPRHTSRSPLASPTSPPAPRQRDLLHKQKSLQEQYARLAEPSTVLAGPDLAGVETVTTYETDIL